jgi:nucleotide-binding universal stress UspA family protein
MTRTILLAYRGTEEDKQVLRWLCRVVKQTRAQLRMVYVLTVPFTEQVDAPEPEGLQEAEQVLMEGEHIAEQEGVIVAADIVQARDAGSGLVSEAEELEANLLVMTDHRHLLPLENPLGYGTVAYVLRHAPCPVWVCYAPDKIVHASP